MIIDARSGWATAPQAARLAGDAEMYRFFGSAEAALAFVAETKRCAINQRRYRQRQRERVSVLPVSVSDDVVIALLEAGRLDDPRSQDRRQVAEEAAEVLRQWAKNWWRHTNNR